MIVNDHELPSRLQALIRAGTWTLATHLHALQSKSGLDAPHDDYFFLSPTAMLDDLRGLHSLIEESPDPALAAYAMYSTALNGTPRELPFLDIDKALPLIQNSGDPFIWLDYRTASEPPVVQLRWEDGAAVWRKIAPDFDHFLLHWLKP